MAEINCGVAVYDRADCIICGASGEVRWSGMRDLLYDAPGVWSLKRCTGADCATHWLDPFPRDGEEAKFYSAYFTHGGGGPAEAAQETPLVSLAERAKAFCRDILRRVHWRPEIFSPSLYYIGHRPPGSLLDVGCGDGTLLLSARALGWSVRGVEFDPAAVRASRERGLDVTHGGLLDASFASASFDAVTLVHVIEHLQNPLEVMTEARRLLRPNGVLVMITPNVESFGHCTFGRHWRGLETPRHLFLYGPKQLRLLGERAGFGKSVCFSATSGVEGLRFFARESIRIRNADRAGGNSAAATADIDIESWVKRAQRRWLLGRGDGEIAVFIGSP